jgi:hypothetical protein
MEFLNPMALLGFFGLPLLLIPYLIRRKPRRLVFSSLLLFVTGAEATSGRPWGRINLPPIFFLQLLLLALLVLSLSEPVFSVRPTNIAIVVDNSASMQTLEDGKTRFAMAKERAGNLIDNLGVTGNVDLYLTTPRLEKVRAAALTLVEARSALGMLDAYDLGDPPADYDTAVSQLARDHKYERVYLITDHPARGQSAMTRVISVGAPQANQAITAFEVHRSSLADARLEASADVSNYSDRDEKIKISLKADGKVISDRQLVVSASKTVSATFEGLPEFPYYQAEIDTRDALPLDNRRYAVAPGSREFKILAITPRPQALTSLRSISGISVDVVAPAEYEKSQRAGYSLEIFHYSTPNALPRNPALFILPPESSPLVHLGTPATNVSVSNWREPHVLTRYINFSLLRPTYARPLIPQVAGEVVIESANGALAFASERQGIRFLTLGFDPLPFLGKGNLPMSIFTLNFLDWFFDSGGARGQATGEPIPLGTPQLGEVVITPKRQEIGLSPGQNYFSGTYYQGIYQLTRGRDKKLIARNLLDTNESDLRSPGVIELRDVSNKGGATSVLFAFWPYLLLVSLLLLLIEWFVNPRMKGMLRSRKPGQFAWRS